MVESPPESLKVVMRPSRRSVSCPKPSQKFESGRDTLPKFQTWSGGPPTGSGVVVRLSLEVREWSAGLPKGPGVVKRPYRKCGSGREALLEVPEW